MLVGESIFPHPGCIYANVMDAYERLALVETHNRLLEARLLRAEHEISRLVVEMRGARAMVECCARDSGQGETSNKRPRKSSNI